MSNHIISRRAEGNNLAAGGSGRRDTSQFDQQPACRTEARGASIPRRRRPRRPVRRGVVALWLIVALPVLLMLVCLLIEIGNIWLARVELENALEAAALAAVKEWGDSGGGDTQTPREVGVTYAQANAVTGVAPAPFLSNRDPGNAPNQNADCAGNLVFGAITHGAIPYEFNAGVTPSCGGAPVLFDASGQGNLQTASNNEWGVAFQVSSQPLFDPNLRIDTVLIDLRAGGGSGSWGPASPALSSNATPYKVRDNSGNQQPDIFGFDAPATQISFSLVNAHTLRIDFGPGTADDGFAPGDRFRFGAEVTGVSSGLGGDDGDGIGRDAVGVTVIFSTAATTTGTFFDNRESSNACIDAALTDPVTGTLVVHPSRIADLPCPPSSSGTNNGQSYVRLQGGGGDPFAVRAQATVPVQSICCRLCGTDLGVFSVSACATAMYDCETRRPRLIRVRPEDLVCPGP
jgi:hypothetical protein